MVKYVIIAYFVLVNIIGFLMMGIDKSKARRHRLRIPERRLFACAFLGGSVGSLLGMAVWRHKTKHLKFTLGIPAILLIEAAVIAGIIYLVTLS